jgi:hypothetical protein
MAMDDGSVLRNMILAGVFIAAMIGCSAWQVLRLLGKGGIDAIGVVRLAASLFVLGIMCWVGYTALALWT